jgi:hypothetical protein
VAALTAGVVPMGAEPVDVDPEWLPVMVSLCQSV